MNRHTISKYNSFLADIGKKGLNAIFPKDFEVYMVAIELADSQDVTIDYFVFPITPSQIQKIHPKRTSIKKSASGTTVLKSLSFVPEEVSIKGNFGRGFKVILQNESSVEGVAFSATPTTEGRSLKLKTGEFDVGVKTGFGATKILQNILNKSEGLDVRGKPLRLYFYNMPLSESYLVTLSPSGFTLSQNEAKNMIWEYSLSFTVLAPLDALKPYKSKDSSTNLLATSIIQKGINSTISAIKTIL